MINTYTLRTRPVKMARTLLASVWLALLPLLVLAQTPLLTAVSPFIGQPGTVVTLTGTGLVGTSSTALPAAPG